MILVLITLAVGLAAIALTFGTLYLRERRMREEGTYVTYTYFENDADLDRYIRETMSGSWDNERDAEYDLVARNGDSDT